MLVTMADIYEDGKLEQGFVSADKLEEVDLGDGDDTATRTEGQDQMVGTHEFVDSAGLHRHGDRNMV